MWLHISVSSFDDSRLSKISVTSITRVCDFLNYGKFTMVSYKSGTDSQVWIKLDIIMQKIWSMFLMDNEKHISGGVQQVEKPFVALIGVS